MRGQRLVLVVVASAVAGSVGLAQPGRGGSQWLTSLADAQRTSWVRTDEKISVGTLSKPGFEQQWKAKLDNQPRGPHGLGQGVTASGVTLFVPISLVTGSSNNVYAIDNDTGYVVWQRHFDAALARVNTRMSRRHHCRRDTHCQPGPVSDRTGCGARLWRPWCRGVSQPARRTRRRRAGRRACRRSRTCGR